MFTLRTIRPSVRQRDFRGELEQPDKPAQPNRLAPSGLRELDVVTQARYMEQREEHQKFIHYSQPRNFEEVNLGDNQGYDFPQNCRIV